MGKEIEDRIRRGLESEESEPEQLINNMILIARTRWSGSMRREKIKFFGFLLAQIRYIGLKIWISELVITAIPLFILFQFVRWHTITQTTAVFLLCCLTIATFMLCIPFIYRSAYYQMWEIEAVTFFSIKKLLLSRILILSAGELAAIAGVGILTFRYAVVDLKNSMVCMLFLFGALCNGLLLFVRKAKIENLCRYFGTYGAGLLLAMALFARFLPETFDGTFYMGMILGSCIFLGYGIYQGRLLAGWPEELCMNTL